MSRIAHFLFTTKTLTLFLIAATVLGFVPAASAASTGGVAVIDLDRVAAAMGWLDDLNKNLQAVDTELRTQLQQALRASVKAIEDVKAEVAADAKLSPDQIKTLNGIQDTRELAQLPLSKEQREKLIDTVNRANAIWQNAQSNYQQQLQQRRAGLVLSYRDKIRPFARRVATARGLSVVLVTGDTVLLTEPSADITNDVIDELQKSGLQKIIAPAPVAPDKPGASR